MKREMGRGCTGFAAASVGVGYLHPSTDLKRIFIFFELFSCYFYYSFYSGSSFFCGISSVFSGNQCFMNCSLWFCLFFWQITLSLWLLWIGSFCGICSFCGFLLVLWFRGCVGLFHWLGTCYFPDTWLKERKGHVHSHFSITVVIMVTVNSRL